MIKKLILLVWPVTCAGCNVVDQEVCPKCKLKLQEYISPTVVVKDDVEVYSGSNYQDTMRKLLLKWKDHGRLDLDRVMCKIVRQVAIKFFNSECKKFLNRRLTSGRNKIIVVPCPSSRSSVKKRTRLQTLSLALAVASELKKLGVPAQVKQILKQKNIKKQVNFDSAQRAQNKQNALYVVRRHRAPPQGKGVLADKTDCAKLLTANCERVVLVDDVCTTGATFRASKLVLASAGIDVVGCIALSSTVLE
ncbi:MAG: hypothetical protein LBQ41_02290 [Candidatus Ancillula sp.]|nr:hypothetical protein [Candidatus Ancillula sp.]